MPQPTKEQIAAVRDFCQSCIRVFGSEGQPTIAGGFLTILDDYERLRAKEDAQRLPDEFLPE